MEGKIHLLYRICDISLSAPVSCECRDEEGAREFFGNSDSSFLCHCRRFPRPSEARNTQRNTVRLPCTEQAGKVAMGCGCGQKSAAVEVLPSVHTAISVVPGTVHDAGPTGGDGGVAEGGGQRVWASGVWTRVGITKEEQLREEEEEKERASAESAPEPPEGEGAGEGVQDSRRALLVGSIMDAYGTCPRGTEKALEACTSMRDVSKVAAVGICLIVSTVYVLLSYCIVYVNAKAVPVSVGVTRRRLTTQHSSTYPPSLPPNPLFFHHSLPMP